MEEKSFLQKIIDFIKNFIKIIIIAILSFFRALFKSNKEDKSKYIKKEEIANTTSKNNLNNNSTSLPNEPNTKTNPDINVTSDESNTTQEIILELPQNKYEKLNSKITTTSSPLYTYETIQLLIEEELEEKYKEDNFKIKDAYKDILEKIEELEKKIIPTILEKINDNKLTTEKEIKKEIEEVVEEELIEKPIFSKKEVDEKYKKDSGEKTPKEEMYSIALPLKKELKIPENKVNKTNYDNKITTLPEENNLKDKLQETPVMMVQNANEIPKPNTKDQVKTALATTTIISANIAKSIINPETKNEQTLQKEDEDKVQEQSEISEDIKPQETLSPDEIASERFFSEVKNDLEKDTKTLEELTRLQEELTEKIEQIKDEDKEQDSEKEKIVKELVKDTEISALTITSESLINESKVELEKEEFEDRDYDRVERQINKMLDDITNTFLKYENKMSKKQKDKLKKEEENLQNAKEYIQTQRSHDLTLEQTMLNEEIHETEIKGIHDELKKIDEENKSKVNEDLFRRMNKLEGMTAEEVAKADKKIMLKRFNKASILLEMSSLLSLPFIRNKYFFYFTVGLIIDNHFNFINSFFKRKINKNEPPDLSNIKRGQDALNGALDITYKNLVELDYLEEQALAKYPELAYDQDFINQVTRLRMNLNSKYNKLMKKNKTMEKYYMKSKYQSKILKKD